ncbi:MAG: DUF6377 domain-containing protein [Clostridium sp.]|nr:DUF6377 domain-containing protein [Prevotella sp.]MCM1429530.1 DUF6377 domain-containing protein [Clostridium sp.]MCM1476146.1 DUF6377 domain-containing protein [Muribaculaceae bacterium]
MKNHKFISLRHCLFSRIIPLIISAIFVVVLCIGLHSCDRNHSQPNDNIATLDSLLNERQSLERIKMSKLNELKSKRLQASSPSDIFSANKLLFDEFSTYQADSAMKYVDENLQLANSTGNLEWEIKSKIDKSELLAGTGLLSQSGEIMASINRSTIPQDLLTDYYGQMIFLYSHIGNYTGGQNDYYVKERAYKDSIIAIIDDKHPDYLWYKGWDVLGTDQSSDKLIAALVEKLSNSKLNSRQDAKDAYILAKLYEEKGDKANYKKYMALSAIVDVKTVNAEIASLEDLAKIMFNEGDIDHAYSYINYSLNKAISFPNRVKAFGITQTLDKVYDVYQKNNARQQKATNTYLILVCIFAIIMIILTVTVVLQNRKLSSRRKNLDEINNDLNNKVSELSLAHTQLNEANERLRELNANLTQKNEELNEANFVKEEYIGYVFNICSNYISRLGDLKRNIHIKAVQKKLSEIEIETADVDMKRELKEFYRSFDTIFLHIYPDFVNDFNTLLQDDKQIVPREGELLNTELRIYALVRLGITDSVKIADFLHCSAQTVYNNRFKVRNKARIPREKFAEAVRMLGKYIRD